MGNRKRLEHLKSRGDRLSRRMLSLLPNAIAEVDHLPQVDLSDIVRRYNNNNVRNGEDED